MRPTGAGCGPCCGTMPDDSATAAVTEQRDRPRTRADHCQCRRRRWRDLDLREGHPALEHAGFVRRSRYADDKRSFVIEPTAASRASAARSRRCGKNSKTLRSAASARTSVGRFCACWKSSKKDSPRPPPSCGSDPNPPAKIPSRGRKAAQRQAPVTRSTTNAAFDVLWDSTSRGEISLAVEESWRMRHRSGRWRAH